MSQLPTYPTTPTAYVFQKFANINFKMYGKTDGKHMGIDIGVVSGQPGAPIYAAYEGLVTYAGWSEQGGYGRRVVIEHEGGQYQTLYAHLQKVMINAGERVETGQQIGTMGGNIEDKNRGASGGTHLHFEVILRDPVPGSIRTSRGYCVDPIPYLMQRYFPAPVNAIQVTSVKGLRVRSKPSVISESVHNLFLKDVVNVMQVFEDWGNEQWVRLWSLREEYSALKYNNQVNAVLVAAETVAVSPVTTPAKPSVDRYEEGFNAAAGKIKSYLEGLKPND
jgi:murein DD-endopeptidase MepM/ murein hydrolase activator NlpD